MNILRRLFGEEWRCRLFGHKWHRKESWSICIRCYEKNPKFKCQDSMKAWVHREDDGDITIEWCTRDCRFAIFLGKNLSESGWYYISRCRHRFMFDGPLPAELFEKAGDPGFLETNTEERSKI
jgi:hypothetical protein